MPTHLSGEITSHSSVPLFILRLFHPGFVGADVYHYVRVTNVVSLSQVSRAVVCQLPNVSFNVGRSGSRNIHDCGWVCKLDVTGDEVTYNERAGASRPRWSGIAMRLSRLTAISRPHRANANWTSKLITTRANCSVRHAHGYHIILL